MKKILLGLALLLTAYGRSTTLITTDFSPGFEPVKNANITSAPNDLPIVKLIQPSPQLKIKAGDSVLFEATASDPDGFITRVDFEVDGVVIGSSLAQPYRAIWKAIPGATRIIARAYDNELYAQTDTIELIVSIADFFVKIKNPLGSSVHTTGNGILIEAAVKKSSPKPVDAVSFFVNDQLIGVDSLAPYFINWTAQTGDPMIKVRATSGMDHVEDFVMIRVQDPATNEPPVARIVEYYNGNIFSDGDNVSINVSATDVDGTIKDVEFFVNGISIEIDTLAPFSVNWKAITGRADITAIARDNKGAKSQLSNSYKIYVDSKSPMARIKIAQPILKSIYKTGDVVTIDAYHMGMVFGVYYKRSPVDFYVNNVHIGSALTYPYKVDWVATKGKAVIRAVTKNYQEILADSLTITVEDNNRNIMPVTDIINPRKNYIANPGTPITIHAKATDADGTISSVTFFVNDTLIGVDNTAPYSMNVTPHLYYARIKIVAKDNQGGEGSDSLTIQVTPNTAPTIKINSPSNGQVITNPAAIYISPQVKDLVGKIDQVEFSVNDKSIFIDKEFPYTVLWTPLNGEARIKTVVRDDKGLTAADSVKVTVNLIVDSTEIKITSPNTLFYKAGDVVQVAAEVKPSLYKINYVEFQIDNSTKVVDSVAPYTAQWTATRPGIVELNAFAFHVDSTGATPLANDKKEVYVKRSDFDVKITSPSPNGWFYANYLSKIEAVANDSKNGVLQIEFFVEGISVGADSSYPYIASWLTKQGTTMITAVATNDVGEQVSDTVFVEVLGKRPEIKIHTPLNGQEFNQGDPVIIEAFIKSEKTTEIPPYHVEFFVNGRSLKMDSKVQFEAPYTATWIAEKGYAVIKAVIWTRTSAYPVADSVIVKVNATMRPTVQITNPANGSTFKPGNQLTIDAKALDEDGIVKAVSFFADGVLIGVDSILPYTQQWLTTKEGKVTLLAKATDNSNLTGISAPVEIVVLTPSGISAPDEDDGVLVYPNPSTGFLNIETTENAVAELLSIDGKQLLLQKKINAGQKQLISLETVSNGSYILKIYNDRFLTSRKILINK